MIKNPREWLKQAMYDFDTAKYMFKGGRRFYTVFMCHLSIEKALKGLYARKIRKEPPKTHNLLYFVEKVNAELPEDLYNFVSTLNKVSVPTRYPDDIQVILEEYDKRKTRRILDKSEEVLKWVRERF